MQIKLVDEANGFKDYDVSGCGDIKRICVPHRQPRDEVVNVRHQCGKKTGAIWLGSVEKTIEAHVANINQSL